MSLRVADASFAYAAGTGMENVALRGVTLEVERGGLAVIVGATGSGKTTLLRVAAGLLAPTEGAVSIDGRPASASRDFRGRVGLVFQRPESQFFAPTVLEDVEFGPRNLGLSAGAAREAAREALAAVGLDPDAFGERLPFTLSGGEARRAALAGVLAMRPDYLLLDEPTAGLDAPGRAAVLETIAHARERAGVAVVTHDADDVLAHADSVLVLEAGREAFLGTPADLLAALASGEAGLAAPSEIVRAQMLAGDALAAFGSPTLDEAEAARRLATLAGGAA